MKGTFKWFDDKKGYGFIRPEGGGNDVFCHITAVQKAGIVAQAGGHVVFDISNERGKAEAVNLQPFCQDTSLQRAAMYPYWHATFRKKVLAAPLGRSANREACLATLEAIARGARRSGWTVKHTSEFNGRVSSRYIHIPHVGICRVSNHHLHPNQESRKYWNGEVIISTTEWRRVGVPEWLERVHQEASKPLTKERSAA
jgi:cold shock protein